ncbi:hypothetical protein EV175_001521, partial [Coemansia sp. RSA 1933]
VAWTRSTSMTGRRTPTTAATQSLTRWCSGSGSLSTAWTLSTGRGCCSSRPERRVYRSTASRTCRAATVRAASPSKSLGTSWRFPRATPASTASICRRTRTTTLWHPSSRLPLKTQLASPRS